MKIKKGHRSTTPRSKKVKKEKALRQAEKRRPGGRTRRKREENGEPHRGRTKARTSLGPEEQKRRKGPGLSAGRTKKWPASPPPPPQKEAKGPRQGSRSGPKNAFAGKKGTRKLKEYTRKQHVGGRLRKKRSRRFWKNRSGASKH